MAKTTSLKNSMRFSQILQKKFPTTPGVNCTVRENAAFAMRGSGGVSFSGLPKQADRKQTTKRRHTECYPHDVFLQSSQKQMNEFIINALVWLIAHGKNILEIVIYQN